ncbi:NepR family anti-sigma factor [Croceibacterium aestuarii]|uniref:NepR family anti-sigma factor n=1 Tax=Croceibacterium aestuarii TaxID=3064139 RepID=UPI00272E2FDB|nr:NepR family anti-sigma factor [Croceibacterium sp. D39]
MAGRTQDKRAAPPGKGKAAPGESDWTKGLKKLYDSVVDEPLPDSFRDLLSKLDSED